MKAVNRTSTWVGAAAVVSVLVMVAAWSPALDEASVADEDRATAELRNAQLQRTITQLKADFARMPEFEAELEQLRQHVPASAQLDAYNAVVDEYAKRHDVVVLSFEAGAAAAVLPITGADGAASASPLAGLYAIPLTITTLGDHDDVSRFLDDLQLNTPRLMAVQGLVLTRQNDAPESNGRPATSPDDTEEVLVGHVFVLSEAAQEPGVAAPTEEAPAESEDEAEESDEGAENT
jgi:Tfp pilus assembly protein PilO